jgi:DNA-binding NarL/FixJ family response regulator
MTPQEARLAAQRQTRQEAAAQCAKVPPKTAALLQGLCEGRAQADMAPVLDLPASTITRHLAAARKGLDTHNITDTCARFAQGQPRTAADKPTLRAWRAGIEALTPTDQDLLKLVTLGFEVDDLAGLLDTTATAVRARVHRLRGRLGVATTEEAAARYATVAVWDDEDLT